MNEQAIQDSYNVFVSNGYTKSIDDFKKLISTNPTALKDSYDVFVSNGYGKSIDDYKSLMGVKSQESTPIVKKKITSELPSQDGSLVSQKTTKIPEITQKGFEQAMAKRTDVPTDMSGKPIVSASQIKTEKVFSKAQEENQKLQDKKKEYGDLFDKQIYIKPKEESLYLKDRLASINTDLINKTEDDVVAEMKYQFGDLGFKFETEGMLGDYMKVTAPNGKTSKISLDNLFDSKSKEQSQALQKFIKDNTSAKGLFVLEKSMREQDKKFNSDKQIDDSIKGISNEVNALNARQKEFLLKKSSFEKDLNTLGPSPELEQKRLALNEEMKSIFQEEEAIKKKSEKLNSAVGKYSIVKSKQGSWGGAIWNAINEGASSISAGMAGLATDIATEVAPAGFGMSPKDLKNVSADIAKKIGVKEPSASQTIEQWKETLTEDQLDKWEDEVDDYIKKDIKSKTLPLIRIGNREVIGDVETTRQFSELKESGFWGGAILGVAKSLPAMIGGAGPAGWAQRTAQMYSQISDGLAVEMENNPDFSNITENEKLAITLPIGITSAVLEAYGLRNVMASKGVINSLTMSVLGKAGANTSARTFRELVENEIESKLAKGLLTITAGGIAEFETGAAQELTETGFKVIYDELKGKDMFNTPDSVLDLIENVAVAGAQEAIGGFVLGVPSGVSAAYSKKGFLKMDDASFETFANMANDEKMQSAYITNLKDKITQGLMTTSEAKKELNDYRNSVGLFKSLPEGLSTQQKKEAMNLLKEKRDLENQVDGKDAALVVKQKNRINEINDSLTKLSETNAVQEQTTDESVLRTEQPELGLQEMGEGNTQPQGTPSEKETITTPQPEEVTKDYKLPIDSDVNTMSVVENDGKFLIGNYTEGTETENPTLKSIFDLEDNPLLFNTKEEAQAKLDEIKNSELKPVEEAILNEPIVEGPTSVPEDFDVVTETPVEVSPVAEAIPVTELTPIEIQESRVESAQSLLDEAKTKTAKKKAMTDLVAEQGKLAEMKANERVQGVESVIDLDTKDETNLKKVYDFLDSLDTNLDLDPNELNDVTRVMAIATAKLVVKTLKALVATGITLQEAIKKVAADNNLKTSDVVKAINALSEIVKIEPGYNELMTKAEKLIARQKSKNISNEKIVSNLDTMVRKSEVYLNANDAQKKIMEREARAKMGVAPRKGASIGRVLGVLKDIKNVSKTDKMLIIKNIRELSRDVAKDLANEIRELKSKGSITTVQAANIISRFGKVNMLNEASVSNFVDYMANIFADAEYGNKIEVAKSKLKNAKKNIVTKLGIADGLVLPLQQLFSINPNLIPVKNLDRYLELLEMLSKRQSVLTLEEKSLVIKDVQDILSEIDSENSKANELAYRFESSNNKIFDEDGNLDYAESIKKMFKEGEIDSEELDLMKKYKKEIVPQVEKEQRTEEDIQKEKSELIKEVKKSTINSSELALKDERDAAKKIAELIKGKAIESLSNTELKNLLKVIDNINNGYFPHYAQLIKEKLNSEGKSSVFKNALSRAKTLAFSMLYSKAKSKLTGKEAVLELIRRNPLFYIDQVFSDFKTKDIFNSILRDSAEGEAKFSSEIKKIQDSLEKALTNVSKSFNRNGNKVIMSKYKMMTYMLQLEYESNEGSNQVNPAAEYLEATIKKIGKLKTKFNEADAKMLQDILDNYSTDGSIDNNKLYSSFNSAEKAAIKTIREINESLTEKAQYTSAIIRGQRINPLTNYIHLNVLNDGGIIDEEASLMNSFNDSRKPSTKAKSLIERTKGAKAIDFDIFASVNRGAKGLLLDYHLTEPIRTARKTINAAVSELEAEGDIPKDKRKIINAVEEAFEEAVSNLLENSYISTSLGNEIADYVSRQGYRTVLASTGRFASEFISNVGFVLISDPTTFSEGLNHMGVMMSADGASIMNNVNSTETNRIFPSDQLSGRLIDGSILSQTSGERGATASGSIANKARQIWNLTGKKYKNVVELTSDVLISTPDKAIMRPIWFGAFASQFKKETGNEVDFEKIASNDEAYMNENKDAIKKSKVKADERSVITGASKNAFTGILKGANKTTNTITQRAFNNFNNFMSTFLIYEFITARTGVMAAIGNGSLTKKQGAALLGGVVTRMTVYSLMTKALGTGLVGLLFGDDDDEEEKSLGQNIGQSLASTFTSLLLGRDFGNATKTLINIGVEKYNEKYLQGLRTGEYDPYKDAIQFTAIPPEKEGQERGISDYMTGLSGSYQPIVKTLDLIAKKGLSEDKKTEDAQERLKQEKKVRIPLEVLGNLGFVPLYKEVRKVVMNDIYKSLKEGDGISQQELKKTNPRMYERIYGEGSAESRVKNEESESRVKEIKSRIKERENRIR